MTPNKIAVITMVRNEEDIIESFVRHCACFSDFHLICDHMSTDRTLEILELLQSEGLPITLFSFKKHEFALREIMTELLYQAIDLGADIILPLDGDEFLIKTGGNAQDLRKKLQNLDSNQIYDVPFFNLSFSEPTKDQDLFALSRPCFHSDLIEEPGRPRKIIVGKDCALSNNLEIAQGNHRAKRSDGVKIQNEHLNDLINFHLQVRSQQQMISKFATSWLNSILFGTRYTPNARYLSTEREKYLSDEFDFESEQAISFQGQNIFPADELRAYAQECKNLYTSRSGTTPLRNVFLLAEDYANLLVRERILSKQIYVRIFVFFDGDVERTIQSLDSCFEQTYEFKNISIVLLTTENLESLYNATKHLPIILIDREDLQDEFQNAPEMYFQFLIPGDTLHPEKIMRSMEFMHSDLSRNVFFCAIDIEDSIELGFFPKETIDPKFNVRKPIELLRTNELEIGMRQDIFVNKFAKSGGVLISGLSRGFFNREVFRDADWINDWISILGNFCLESSEMHFMINVALRTNFRFLNEVLVNRGAREWTESDLKHHQQLHQLIKNKCEENGVI